MPAAKVDINCDMGEGLDNEASLMPFITSANIACGAHAGDKDTIRFVIELCKLHGVKIGAHPSYNDRENFGRQSVKVSDEVLYSEVQQQILLIRLIADELGGKLHHVKPHGALYNDAAKDPALAALIAKAVADVDPSLVLYGLSGSFLVTEGRRAGLKTANEVFADRTYQDDGSLTPRSQPGALIDDPQIAVEHVNQMVEHRKIKSVNGTFFPVVAETICIHGDGPGAIAIARAIHQAFHKTNQL
jgi:5-oxoprolinase (ATP-hydrolysing) subunit A